MQTFGLISVEIEFDQQEHNRQVVLSTKVNKLELYRFNRVSASEIIYVNN